jgi:hypothetical protein
LRIALEHMQADAIALLVAQLGESKVELSLHEELCERRFANAATILRAVSQKRAVELANETNEGGLLPLHAAVQPHNYWYRLTCAPTAVVQRLVDAFPDAVRTRTGAGGEEKKGGDEENKGGDEGQGALPLHLALRLWSELALPETSLGDGFTERDQLDSVALLLAAFPDAVVQPDAKGRLPLHEALRVGTPTALAVSLLRASPKAASLRDERGLLPLHYAVGVAWPDAAALQALLTAHPGAAMVPAPCTVEVDGPYAAATGLDCPPLFTAIRLRHPASIVRGLLAAFPGGPRAATRQRYAAKAATLLPATPLGKTMEASKDTATGAGASWTLLAWAARHRAPEAVVDMLLEFGDAGLPAALDPEGSSRSRRECYSCVPRPFACGVLPRIRRLARSLCCVPRCRRAHHAPAAG